MERSELKQLIKEEIKNLLKEEKSELSGILFDISTLLDSLDNEQLENKAGLNSKDLQLLRKSIDTMLSGMKMVKHLINVQDLK